MTEHTELTGFAAPGFSALGFGAVAASVSAPTPVAEAAHAVLSASGAERWIACPGSVALEKMFQDRQTEFSAEGTLAHDILALKLELHFELINAGNFMLQMQPLLKHALYKKEMERYTDECKDFCVEQYNKAKLIDPSATVFIETRLDFSRWVPNGYGRGDFGVICNGWAHFVDFKYGKGKPVSAVKNPQVRLYGAGTYSAFNWMFNIQKMDITIHQPRIGNIETETITTAELLQWLDAEVAPAAKRAWAIHDGSQPATDADYTPGKHCTFCKARGSCRKRAEWAQSTAGSLPAPGLLTPAEIAALLPKVGAVASWAKDIGEFALEQARDFGVVYPGKKLVAGRSDRYIKTPLLAAEHLVSKGFQEAVIYKDRELHNIGDLERVVGGKKRFTELLKDFIEKPDGKPTLVDEHDPRETWTPARTAESVFSSFIQKAN